MRASAPPDSPLAPPPSRRARSLRRTIALSAGTLVFLALCLAAWPRCFPPIPHRLTLEVTFPPGIAGTGEPLVVTGISGDSDTLAVKYLDAHTGVLLYDVWGVGGPVSPPFALESGKVRTLDVEMPTLPVVTHLAPREKRPLRVTLDGRELLRDDVFLHRRAPDQLYFALNPLGGTIAAPAFRGLLRVPDGPELRGGPASLIAWPRRLPWLIRGRALPLLRDLALAALAGLLIAQLTRLPAACRRWSPPAFRANPRPPHLAFALTAAACLALFSAVITGGSFRLLFPDEFANFYDHQAASFLRGRLDVAPASLSGESFVFEGKTYGYFGPTPALLRLPFVALNLGFGQLTRLFMVAYLAAGLAAVYVILIHATRLAAGADLWPSRFNTVLLTAIAGLGSTLFFLGSRAYIYHEAILCGAAFSLWATYFALRHLLTPAASYWLPSLLCGVASVHSRPPIGLFALCVLGSAALFHLVRALFPSSPSAPSARHAASSSAAPSPSPTPFSSRLRRAASPLAIGTAATLGILSFNALSYLKFRSFEGAPLRYHVQYHPARLANIDGKNFHVSNLAYNTGAYLWRPAFEFRPHFPFYFISGSDPAAFPGSKIDLAEPMTALPSTMPALCFLAVLGGALALLRWPQSRQSLAVIALAALPMAAALFTAVAVSQRYTSDFCPALLAAAAFGLVALETLPARASAAARLIAVALTLVSVFITIAITLHYQGEGVWGVPDDIKQRYESLRGIIDAWVGAKPPAPPPR